MKRVVLKIPKWGRELIRKDEEVMEKAYKLKGLEELRMATDNASDMLNDKMSKNKKMDILQEMVGETFDSLGTKDKKVAIGIVKTGFVIRKNMVSYISDRLYLENMDKFKEEYVGSHLDKKKMVIEYEYIDGFLDRSFQKIKELLRD